MYFLNEISAVRTANQVFQILLTCSFNFFSDSISILVSRVHNRALNLSTSWLTLAGVIQNICINIHYIQCITYQCNTMYRHGRISMRGYWGWGPCPHPPPPENTIIIRTPFWIRSCPWYFQIVNLKNTQFSLSYIKLYDESLCFKAIFLKSTYTSMVRSSQKKSFLVEAKCFVLMRHSFDARPKRSFFLML